MAGHPEFPLRDGLHYLNHAAVAPLPRRTAEAIAAFAHEAVSEGTWNYRRWEQTEQALREQLQRLIGAESPDDIALVKSTSEALSFIAHGLDWIPGDNIVTFREEFPSNRWVWESLRRLGVETRLAHLTGVEDPEEALFSFVDDRTRLVSVSSVQYGTGFRVDLPRIGQYCREREILFCVDAIQSLGALPFDVAQIGCDFVAADGHKWMLAPEGLGLFWVRPDLRDKLQLVEIGWHSHAPLKDYDQIEAPLAPGARRFECGSPNMLGIHALHASLSLIEEVGIKTIEDQILRNSALLIELISASRGFELLTVQAPRRLSGIVTFRHRKYSPAHITHHLRSHSVLAAVRGGGVRFSPHFYNTEEELQHVWEFVKQVGRKS
ncbi:MAG: aminotransferase class V-fold PLP-dependent enzyme [Gammaproteobacteria bacterium]